MLVFGILGCLNFLTPGGAGIFAGIVAVLQVVAASIVLCCGPKSLTQGEGSCQYQAAAIMAFIVGGLECVCILLIILAMAGVGQVSGGASQACQDANDLYAAMGMENPNPCHDVVGTLTGIAQAFLVVGLILCLLNAILCFVFGYKSWKAKTAIMNLTAGYNAGRPKRPKNIGATFRFMGESKAVGPAHSGDAPQDTTVRL